MNEYYSFIDTTRYVICHTLCVCVSLSFKLTLFKKIHFMDVSSILFACFPTHRYHIRNPLEKRFPYHERHSFILQGSISHLLLYSVCMCVYQGVKIKEEHFQCLVFHQLTPSLQTTTIATHILTSSHSQDHYDDDELKNKYLTLFFFFIEPHSTENVLRQKSIFVVVIVFIHIS